MQVFVLSIPLSVAITIPMAVLVATMAAFGRLAGDSEITAIQANGVAFTSSWPRAWPRQSSSPCSLSGSTIACPRKQSSAQPMMEIQRAKPTVVLKKNGRRSRRAHASIASSLTASIVLRT